MKEILELVIAESEEGGTGVIVLTTQLSSKRAVAAALSAVLTGILNGDININIAKGEGQCK